MSLLQNTEYWRTMAFKKKTKYVFKHLFVDTQLKKDEF